MKTPTRTSLLALAALLALAGCQPARPHSHRPALNAAYANAAASPPDPAAAPGAANYQHILASPGPF